MGSSGERKQKMKGKNSIIGKVKKIYHSIRNLIYGLPWEGFDLAGEKYPDWGWCLSKLAEHKNKEILDIGCSYSPISMVAVGFGNRVWGIDTTTVNYLHPNFNFIDCDFLEYDFGVNKFDCVVICSVIEHIGLEGRYGQKEIPNGDLLAMQKVRSLLKENARLIITIPVGQDFVYKPFHRIYGKRTLPNLFSGYKILDENFWVKQGENWLQCTWQEAQKVDRKGLSYGLGQYVLCVDNN